MPYLVDSDVLVDLTRGSTGAADYLDGLSEAWSHGSASTRDSATFLAAVIMLKAMLPATSNSTRAIFHSELSSEAAP